MSHDNTVPVYKALSLCYFREVCKTGWLLRAERGLQPHFTDEETEPQRGAAGVQVPRPGSSAGAKTVRKNGGGAPLGPLPREFSSLAKSQLQGSWAPLNLSLSPLLP